MNRPVNQCNVLQPGITGGGIVCVKNPRGKVGIKSHKVGMQQAEVVEEKR